MNLKHGPWLWHTCRKAQSQTMKEADRHYVPWQDIIAEMNITCDGVRDKLAGFIKGSLPPLQGAPTNDEICFSDTWNP